MYSALVGGTHHAFRDRGEGFCAFNDIAVGAAAVMAEHGLERILVIDLDVHQARLTCILSVHRSCPDLDTQHGMHHVESCDDTRHRMTCSIISMSGTACAVQLLTILSSCRATALQQSFRMMSASSHSTCTVCAVVYAVCCRRP